MAYEIYRKMIKDLEKGNRKSDEEKYYDITNVFKKNTNIDGLQRYRTEFVKNDKCDERRNSSTETCCLDVR